MTPDNSNEPNETEPLHRLLGLTDDEAGKIATILGREPNHLELAMYSVMWSEHCSYKSSRVHLKRLPTQAPHVLVGPGENAGVIDVGDGIAVALRIESHNHPSAIEPYQGAATGVGGILRDIFTMGARPICLADSLWFGSPESPRSRWICEGVVSGISGYGNAVGVPTIAGEVNFDEAYSGNPLVNVMCIGVLPKERLVLGQASGSGNLAVLLGQSTGRDGIGGVSVLASAPLEDGDESAQKRPSVQVGDPFEEKRLIEACLELLDAGVVVGIQDLGGAGLTCATSETASRGNVGMDVDISKVIVRQSGMEPFEIMISESQERMLAIIAPSSLGRLEEICNKWEVAFSVIGKVTLGDKLRILSGSDNDSPSFQANGPDHGYSSDHTTSSDQTSGFILAEVPASSLAQDAPIYMREMQAPVWFQARHFELGSRPPDVVDVGTELISLLANPSIRDKSWIYNQYDHQLFLNTVVGPGGDGTVLRLKAPGLPKSDKGLAVSVDGNSRWCSMNPRLGAKLIVAESVANLACCGAFPKALVNCLNFGNPEHPEVMWQLSETVDGIAEACTAMHLPVVGGNVSFYNESGGYDIPPTPVIGTLGVIEKLLYVPPTMALVDNCHIFLLGDYDSNVSGSRWAFDLHEYKGGSLTEINFARHSSVMELVISLVRQRMILSVHDISDGGMLVALTEMAIKGEVGFSISGINDPAELFSEGPSRVIVGASEQGAQSVIRMANDMAVPLRELGVSGGDRLAIRGLMNLSLASARDTWTGQQAPAQQAPAQPLATS